MKKVLKAIGLIILMLVIYYLAQGIVGVVLSIARVVQLMVPAAASHTTPDVKALTEELTRYIGTLTPWILLIAVAITVPLYYLIYRRRKQELWAFVSFEGIHPISIPVLIVFGVTLNIVIDALLTLVQQIPALKPVFENYDQLTSMIFGGGFVPTLIAVGIVGPIFEELLFRGLVFGELRKITKVRAAIIIQALLFGIYHLNLVQGTYAFLIGIILGYVYYRSSSIIAPMIVHITINSSSAILGLMMSGEASGTWSGVVIIASVLLFIVTGVFIITHRSFRHAMDDSLYISNHPPKLQGPPTDGQI